MKLVNLHAATSLMPASNLSDSWYFTTGMVLPAGAYIEVLDPERPPGTTRTKIVQLDKKSEYNGVKYYAPWFVGYNSGLALRAVEYKISPTFRFADLARRACYSVSDDLRKGWLALANSDSLLKSNIRVRCLKADQPTPKDASALKTYMGYLTAPAYSNALRDVDLVVSDYNEASAVDNDGGSLLACNHAALFGYRVEQESQRSLNYSRFVNNMVDVVESEIGTLPFCFFGYDFDESETKGTGMGLFAALRSTYYSWYYSWLITKDSLDVALATIKEVAQNLEYNTPDISPLLVECAKPPVSDFRSGEHAVIGFSYDATSVASRSQLADKVYLEGSKSTRGYDTSHFVRLQRSEMAADHASPFYGISSTTGVSVSRGMFTIGSISVLDLLATWISMAGRCFRLADDNGPMKWLSLQELQAEIGGYFVYYNATSLRQANDEMTDRPVAWLPVADDYADRFFFRSYNNVYDSGGNLVSTGQRNVRFAVKFETWAKLRNIVVRVKHIDRDYPGMVEFVSLGTLVSATLTNPGLCLICRMADNFNGVRQVYDATVDVSNTSAFVLGNGYAQSASQIGGLANTVKGIRNTSLLACDALARCCDDIINERKTSVPLQGWLYAHASSLWMPREGHNMYEAISVGYSGDGTTRVFKAEASPARSDTPSYLVNMVKERKGLPAAIAALNRRYISCLQEDFDNAVERAYTMIRSTPSYAAANAPSGMNVLSIGSLLNYASKVPIQRLISSDSLASQLINCGAYVRSDTNRRLKRIKGGVVDISTASTLLKLAILIRLILTSPSTERSVINKLCSDSDVFYNSSYFSMGGDLMRIIESVIKTL